MSEETTQPNPATEPATPAANPPAEAQQPTPAAAPAEPMIPKSRFDEVNKRLKEIEKQQAETAKAREEAERKAAEEQGNWRKLYEDQQARIEADTRTRTELEQSRKAAETSALQLRVAYATGLPLEWADRLRGEDEEQLKADAFKLLEAFPKQAQPKPNLATDSTNGAGSAPMPTALKSDLEIREEANRLGVEFQHLKTHYERLAIKH